MTKNQDFDFHDVIEKWKLNFWALSKTKFMIDTWVILFPWRSRTESLLHIESPSILRIRFFPNIRTLRLVKGSNPPICSRSSLYHLNFYVSCMLILLDPANHDGPLNMPKYYAWTAATNQYSTFELLVVRPSDLGSPNSWI